MSWHSFSLFNKEMLFNIKKQVADVSGNTVPVCVFVCSKLALEEEELNKQVHC